MEVGLEALAPARPHAGLGREVEYDLDAVEVGREIGRREVDLGEREAGLATQLREVSLLQRARIVVGEAIDPEDVVLQIDQALREV